jgi:hypothetical protein
VAGFDNARHKAFIRDSLGIRKDGDERIDRFYRKNVLLTLWRGANSSLQQDVNIELQNEISTVVIASMEIMRWPRRVPLSYGLALQATCLGKNLANNGV